MGKRSNFQRLAQDAYQTVDPKAAAKLVPYLAAIDRARTFVEPCLGEGFLRRHLEGHGLRCTWAGDIATGQDARRLTAAKCRGADVIITNPPWTRRLLHELIRVFQAIRTTWLLFDADWAQNVEAAPLLRHCSHIVPIGRSYWFENSKSTGKDNVAWYRFDRRHAGLPRLVPRGSAIPNEGEHDAH